VVVALMLNICGKLKMDRLKRQGTTHTLALPESRISKESNCRSLVSCAVFIALRAPKIVTKGCQLGPAARRKTGHGGGWGNII